MTLSNLIIILSPTLLISNTLLRCLCENAKQLFPGVVLDPNKGIPTEEELNAMYPAERKKKDSSAEEKDSAAEERDENLRIVREELVQSYVWAQARNDALRYVKEHLKAQLIEERKIVSNYTDQLRDLEDQNYTIGDTVVLRTSRRNKKSTENRNDNRHVDSGEENRNNNSNANKQQETEEDLKLYLSTLEQMNSEYEADKTSLYNSIITETFACIDMYTELRFRQTYSRQKARS